MNIQRIEHLRNLLRSDEHVRSHFDIRNWAFNCGTVGCIAGWAAKIWEPDAFKDAVDGLYGLEETGAVILGLDNRTAKHLFMPDTWATYVNRYDHPYLDLSHNLRPPLLTVEAMKEWAAQYEPTEDNDYRPLDIYERVTHDVAANAIDGILAHPGYVDWREACEA